MLSRFGKRPVSDIRKAILEYDTSILTAENVSALKEFAPEPEEVIVWMTADSLLPHLTVLIFA